MFSPNFRARAEKLLQNVRAKKMRIAVAESCTGGLVSGLLTEIAGASDVFEGAYVAYSNRAKTEMIGVEPQLIEEHGAVSEAVARAMAAGALARSGANIAVAVTGVAGPTGGTKDKPVGLVHIAAARDGRTLYREYRFGAIGREAIRLKSVERALELLEKLLQP
ncbi:MAG: CinA family protein [Alphaproteobacteria bacterium]